MFQRIAGNFSEGKRERAARRQEHLDLVGTLDVIASNLHERLTTKEGPLRFSFMEKELQADLYAFLNPVRGTEVFYLLVTESEDASENIRFGTLFPWDSQASWSYNTLSLDEARALCLVSSYAGARADPAELRRMWEEKIPVHG